MRTKRTTRPSPPFTCPLPSPTHSSFAMERLLRALLACRPLPTLSLFTLALFPVLSCYFALLSSPQIHFSPQRSPYRKDRLYQIFVPDQLESARARQCTLDKSGSDASSPAQSDEPAFLSFCLPMVAPLQASSEIKERHRLNQGERERPLRVRNVDEKARVVKVHEWCEGSVVGGQMKTERDPRKL